MSRNSTWDRSQPSPRFSDLRKGGTVDMSDASAMSDQTIRRGEDVIDTDAKSNLLDNLR